MIKPIVPGCLALYHGGPKFVQRKDGKHYDGYLPAHVMNVVRKESPEWIWPCHNCGAMDNRWRVESSLWRIRNHFACACRLTRIDGHDPDAEITETDKEKEYAHNG